MIPRPEIFTCKFGNAAIIVSAARHWSIAACVRAVSIPACTSIMRTFGNALISSTAWVICPA